ncbi:MAG: hypothetical protein KKB20_20855 [Proteobacteria bacterium]|nr:hypothetical protein [Pseudomonadota bacterium]
MTKPRVLLTANYGPNEPGWGEDMYDVLASRLARGHGPFQLTAHCHYYGLYIIAENISCPTTVLEDPHWEDFDRELDQGYDVVGFQLKSLHTAKIARMMKRVREKRPGTIIVVGGYGVGTLDRPVPGDCNRDADYIRENADHLCREEGVRFMRGLLDDEPVDREITQYHFPMTGFSIPGLEAQARIPVLLVALGCPNACDFCNTSAFFRHRKIYVAEPEQVYRFIKNYQARLRFKDLFVILFDEDIFIRPDYVRELGRLLRGDPETWGVRWFSFGSMRSLAPFDPMELRECGVGSIWIGVESFLGGSGRTEDRYAKRQGRSIEETFAGLHRHGIQTTGSLVLGFDFHTPDNLREDIDRFVALKPTFYQISPLTPCPGTELYERMADSGRILETYGWEDFHLWKDDVFRLKHFQRNAIKSYFDYAHERLRDENGPPPLQIMESVLDSLTVFRKQNGAFHEYQYMRARKMATGLYGFLRACILHHPSPVVRERAGGLERRYREEVGRPPLLSRIISRHIAGRIAKRSRQPRVASVSDPPTRWSYYRTFDDRVWVRKGRQAGKPRPYKDRRVVSVGHHTG